MRKRTIEGALQGDGLRLRLWLWLRLFCGLMTEDHDYRMKGRRRGKTDEEVEE